MAHYDLEEQEQLDTLKTWWKMYGNLVTGVITVIALAMAGWQGWNWYQNTQAAKAAAVFAALEDAAMAKDAARAKAIAGELADKFAGTSYAALGAMMAAKTSIEAGDAKSAKLQLAWVAENGKNEARDIARLRLVTLLIDEKAYDEALKQLDIAPAPVFAPRFAEMKGEALLAQGKKAEAKAAFKAAMGGLDEKTELGRGNYRDLLQQKIDALGESA